MPVEAELWLNHDRHHRRQLLVQDQMSHSTRINVRKLMQRGIVSTALHALLLKLEWKFCTIASKFYLKSRIN